MRIVGIGGGIGAARLWTALEREPDVDLTLVVNTADDMWLHGLRICPDLDTVMYALSGRQDVERGWGLRDETWRTNETLADLGGEAWFGLGDADLATHLFRTGALRRGRSLTDVTSALAAAFGLTVDVLPATNDEVFTEVTTVEHGALHYEEFLVRHGGDPTVRAVRHVGLPARPGPGVLPAIADADLIIIGPSNPVASVAPILGITGVREALVAVSVPVVIVTPIVTARPLPPSEAIRAASRTALLEAWNIRPDAVGVAKQYADLNPTFVLDESDSALSAEIAADGIDVLIAGTLLHEGDSPQALLDALLQPARHRSAGFTANQEG